MIERGSTKIPNRQLEKSPTGISGLDDITDGGLPKGRPTLVCGNAGSGKTLMSMQFLAQGAMQYDEPGVFMAFEESEEDLAKNFASLGIDLNDLSARNKVIVDYVHIDSNEILETGEYDLEGLFIRLGGAIDSIGAKRVVLDTIEVLFSGFQNEAILRSELRRLFRFLKDRGVTAVVTGERGEKSLTRFGLEEYVADCVIALDNRMEDQISTRRLRIVKYRGSKHGTNEYPFLIEEDGISVLPITSLGLEHIVSDERVSSGIERLDTMLGGEGYYRGSSILVSGTSGTGKTSFAAQFANAACERGERCLYFAFEESPSQIIRNMRSIGIDLEPWTQAGLLKIHASRPMAFGLEMHLMEMRKLIDDFLPRSVIIDPITNLTSVGTRSDVKVMLTRLIDYLKTKGITALCTSLTGADRTTNYQTEQGISSLMDAWLDLQFLESDSERNRGLSVVKARGMAHSNQTRELIFTENGVVLRDVYLGPAGGLLMGTSRAAQEARERANVSANETEAGLRKRELEHKLKALDAQIAALRSEVATDEGELEKILSGEGLMDEVQAQNRNDMARLRKADVSNS
ncbi:MAG TPA: circadian clock protein KaiC [Methanotrichaceae archaeon]|nr:circadian clock protein KaiC [Methanotrichaceae archaeon]